jgi:SsrA-binding protein
MKHHPADKKVIQVNRKARHLYRIEDTYEAGLVLAGTEVKSLREGRVNLSDGYARIENGEAWLYNVHISPYAQGHRFNVDPRRPRKLLLHRWEIDRLYGRVQEKGLTIVPLSMFFLRGRAKVELGVGRGKAEFDKRRTILERDLQREAQRQLRERP